jgi:ATP-dependent RNA helicase DeaD
MTTFKDLGLNKDILTSLDDLGFVEPSPIQAESIPFIINSKQDLTALAQTGTGKTAAFGLPILQQISADGKSLQAIVMCPTRELCIQITQSLREFAKHSKGVVVTSVYGGERIDLQIRSLKRGTNIVVGTPGRVHDLIRRKILKLGSIKWLVLDEADEMLDMGFKDDLDAVLEQIPENKQTLLFSATMSPSVASIARKYMSNTHEITVGNKNLGADTVSHEYYIVQARDRFEAVKRILDCLPGVYGILFCRTKRETQEIADKLRQANYDVEAIHGDVSQNIRTKIMDRFKKKQIRVLVATDVAARGIDVKDLTHVINYNLPDQNAAYTHRSGRTGRAGQKGVSVSLVPPRDARRVKELERIIGKSFERKEVPNGVDVYKQQISNFIDSIKNSDIDESANEKYLPEIVEQLKSVTKEELLRHFAAKELIHLINEGTRNLNAEAGSFAEKKKGGKAVTNGVNLQINFGRKNRFDIKSLFSLINSSRELHGIDLGRIDLMPEHSIFAVDGSQADRVIKALSAMKFQGKTIRITRGDAEVSYPRTSYARKKRSDGPSRGKSTRDFKGKKKPFKGGRRDR